jgi:hypothetical protein
MQRRCAVCATRNEGQMLDQTLASDAHVVVVQGLKIQVFG